MNHVESQSPSLTAMLWMTGAIASFCALASGGKVLSGIIPTAEILFIRSLMGLLIVSLALFYSGRRSAFKTENMRLQVFRNIFHYAGQYGWFLGFGFLPLAEVFALEFTVPVWTALIASAFLGETISAKKRIAIVLGLVGVLIIVQPGLQIVQPAALIVLAAAFCYAVSHSATKALSAYDSPMTVLFYMCLIQAPMGLVLSVFDWVWPNHVQLLWILMIALTALSAHFCMTKAMQCASVTTVVTMDFMRLPTIMVVGVVFFAERPEISLVIGGLFMLASNLVSVSRRR
ncbi:Riboflavin transporter [BD1-7 clade bacterium]|uniref:Riboflavin transporter n=1 Tax=BD1-7 clade bacterium TaxID=2029982 RepID=A0A5S9PSU7_9GAMM|nr:Riboflavin transporter [BD1-7 clade bacterium]